MYSLSRQEVSDLYKSYQIKLNNQENSDELGVIAERELYGRTSRTNG